MEQCMDLTFTTAFNGKNVIFIFWLGLLLLPLFEKFEIFGISLKIKRQTEVSINAAYNAIINERIMDADELDQLHRNGGQYEQ